MLIMDFKCKGITWVGNIYQKFEAMIMEVDDIMSQDAVKYVENQMEIVGASVKNFYSELVQDMLLPSSEDLMKGTAPDLSLEQNVNIGTYKNSKVHNEEDPIKVGVEQLPEESEIIVPGENNLSHASSFSLLCDVNHLLPPSSVDPVKGAHPDLSLEQNDDVGAYKQSKVGVKEIPIKEMTLPYGMLELIAPSDKASSGAPLFSKLHNENHAEACDRLAKISPSTSVDTGSNSSQKAWKFCDNLVDGTGHISDISSTFPSPDSSLLVVSCENKVVEIGLTPSSDVLSTEPNDTLTRYETVSVSLMASGNPEEQCSESADVEAFMSLPEIVVLTNITPAVTGRSDDSSAAEVVDSKDVIEPVLETIEPFDKEKIRDRMRLANKREYEQLAIWYGHMDTGFSQERLESFTSSTLSRGLGSDQLPTHDFCESEWEIL
ncbi:hypothetical protein HHK36_001759 [Tetracentron sinense]|uniref:Uncharacterized protein n=1 Tax=Tetracentron sinense TaxID=13715 RepID=A0A835A398_TETSI|nr:hypothetical protein HHK36_001759 [Tetracentron sinense]